MAETTSKQPAAVAAGTAAGGYDLLNVPPLLGRRVWAVAIDATLVGLCCVVLEYSFGPLAPRAARAGVWAPAAVVLGLYAVVEMFTGITPGKRLTGLAIRGAGDPSVPLGGLVLRGFVKLLPVGLYLLSLLLTDPMANLTLWAVNITLILCYLSACYLMLWRTGRTMFDAVAGTSIVAAAPRPAAPMVAASADDPVRR